MLQLTTIMDTQWMAVQGKRKAEGYITEAQLHLSLYRTVLFQALALLAVALVTQTLLVHMSHPLATTFPIMAAVVVSR
jgi:hypothetical protein